MFRQIEFLVILAGFTQLAIAASSLWIPRLLGWQEETAKLRPLTRQVFWTYALYIFSMNVAFGALSLFAPRALTDGSTLARAVCALIALYWLGRVTAQLVVFDRSITATRALFRFAEAGYILGFVYLGVTYSVVAVMS